MLKRMNLSLCAGHPIFNFPFSIVNYNLMHSTAAFSTGRAALKRAI